MRHLRPPAAVLSLVLAALSAAAPAGEGESPRLAVAKILESGDPAPGAGGGTVALVTWAPVAGGDAGVAVRAHVRRDGLPGLAARSWLLTPGGGVRALLAEGDPVPGSDTERVGTFAPPTLGPDGTALFAVPVLAGAEDRGEAPEEFVLLAPGHPPRGFARRGALAVSERAVIEALGTASVAAAGRFALRLDLRAGETVTPAFYRADPEQGLRLLARVGAPAPGAPDLLVTRLPAKPPAMNPEGTCAFLVTAGETTLAVREEPDGTVAVAARPGGEIAEVCDVSIAAGGGLAFVGRRTKARSDALWLAPPGGAPAIVLAAEDLGAMSLEAVALTAAGGLLVSGLIAEEGADEESEIRWGLWFRAPDGAVHRLLREGEPAPGLPGRTFHGGADRFFAGPGGTAAFTAYLAPGEDGALHTGLWLFGPDGEVRLVAAEGGSLTVGDRTRALKDVDVAGDAIRKSSGGSDGRPTALTARGQVLFVASFTDGSSGAFAAGLRR